jgi:hypothetical protein
MITSQRTNKPKKGFSTQSIMRKRTFDSNRRSLNCAKRLEKSRSLKKAVEMKVPQFKGFFLTTYQSDQDKYHRLYFMGNCDG